VRALARLWMHTILSLTKQWFVKSGRATNFGPGALLASARAGLFGAGSPGRQQPAAERARYAVGTHEKTCFPGPTSRKSAAARRVPPGLPANAIPIQHLEQLSDGLRSPTGSAKRAAEKLYQGNFKTRRIQPHTMAANQPIYEIVKKGTATNTKLIQERSSCFIICPIDPLTDRGNLPDCRPRHRRIRLNRRL
jgi:hypothetical protein